MSLMPTDEDNARMDGYRDGERDGSMDTLKELESWLANDVGMISVISIREKIKAMREKL